MPYTLRPISTAGDDDAFLALVFEHALNWDPAEPFLSLTQWQEKYGPDPWPEFLHYSASWGAPEALGITLQAGYLALDAASGERVGGAWLRRFSPAYKGFGYLDSHTPEFCIGLLPGHCGSGLGTRLLRQLCATAGALGCTRLCLSAGVHNPALRLYQRLGARLAAPGEQCLEDFTPAELAREAAVDPEYPNFVLPLPLPPSYLTLITTPSYATGVVALAQSLALTGSRATLTALCTNGPTLAALQAEAAACPPLPSGAALPLRPTLHAVALPAASASAPTLTHGAKGALLCVDAPRRALWAPPFTEQEGGFVLLDADMIAVQNPDPYLAAAAAAAAAVSASAPALLATANFRVKKGCFGSSAEGGNFNSGVMVVPQPLASDGLALCALVQAAEQDGSSSTPEGKATEELLLNELFRGRWGELPHGLNVPKRVLAHAPGVWNALLEAKQLVFVHYMGAKPWQAEAGVRSAADWEAEHPAYAALERVWWEVRQGTAEAGEGGSLLGYLPRGRE